jgi:hypothetical protein
MRNKQHILKKWRVTLDPLRGRPVKTLDFIRALNSSEAIRLALEVWEYGRLEVEEVKE